MERRELAIVVDRPIGFQAVIPMLCHKSSEYQLRILAVAPVTGKAARLTENDDVPNNAAIFEYQDNEGGLAAFFRQDYHAALLCAPSCNRGMETIRSALSIKQAGKPIILIGYEGCDLDFFWELLEKRMDCIDFVTIIGNPDLKKAVRKAFPELQNKMLDCAQNGKKNIRLLDIMKAVAHEITVLEKISQYNP